MTHLVVPEVNLLSSYQVIIAVVHLQNEFRLFFLVRLLSKYQFASAFLAFLCNTIVSELERPEAHIVFNCNLSCENTVSCCDYTAQLLKIVGEILNYSSCTTNLNLYYYTCE